MFFFNLFHYLTIPLFSTHYPFSPYMTRVRQNIIAAEVKERYTNGNQFPLFNPIIKS